MKELEKPLFPSYSFCRIDPSLFLQVLKTPGVVDFVRNDKRPIAIADAEIDAVRRIVCSQPRCSPWPFLRTGQLVRITKGPLAGIEGYLTQFKSGYRVVVSIQLLQRSIAAEVDADCVSAATGRP